jgi:hypothetical protein
MAKMYVVNNELSSVVAVGILNVVDDEPISVIEGMGIEDATKTTSVEVTDENTAEVTIDITGIVVRVGNADGTGDGGGLVAVGETDPCGMDVVAISKNTVLSTAIDAAITEWLISVLFDNISKDTIGLGFNGKSTVSEGIGEDIENRGVVVTLKRNSLVGGTKVTFSVIFGRDDSIEYGIRVDGIICRVIVRLVAIIIVVEDNDTVTCGDVASTLVDLVLTEKQTGNRCVGNQKH